MPSIKRSGGLLASLVLALQAWAQPPMLVDWYDELQIPDITFAYIHPVTGAAEILFGSESTDICYYDETTLTFGGAGEISPWPSGFCFNCATFDNLLGAPYKASGSRFVVFNVLPYATPWYPVIHIGFGECCDIGSTVNPPGSEHADCLLPNEATYYLGGIGDDCSPQPGTIYTNAGWLRRCLPHRVYSLEIQSDTLVAIGFPAVSLIDAQNGTVLDSFDLFTGPAASSGKSCMQGDTLYWSCSTDGNVHVGKYILGTGVQWEQTLPFDGSPEELFLDDFGRLWTAVGNHLVWLDALSGYAAWSDYGSAIRAMDLQGGSILIAGLLDASTSFIIRATPTP